MRLVSRRCLCYSCWSLFEGASSPLGGSDHHGGIIVVIVITIITIRWTFLRQFRFRGLFRRWDKTSARTGFRCAAAGPLPEFPWGISQATMLLPHKWDTHFTGARINTCNTWLVNHPGSLITGFFVSSSKDLSDVIYICTHAHARARAHSRVSFYDGVTFPKYLVVNLIVVKRVLFKWFKLGYVHGPNKLVK